MTKRWVFVQCITGGAGIATGVHAQAPVHAFLGHEEETIPVHRYVSGQLHAPVVCPHDDRIFAVEAAHQGTNRLWLVREPETGVYAASPAIEVTPSTTPDDLVGFSEHVPASYAGGLAWCPLNVTPGRYWFAYVSTDSEGSTDLYLGNTEQPASIRLTQLPGREVHPTWSADGRDLAFVAAGVGNGDLYVVPNLLDVMGAEHASPGPPLAVTEGPAVDIHPAFSPDGRHLLFSRSDDPSTDYRLHVLDLDQVKPWGTVDAGVVRSRTVLDIDGQATRGTFSPDAKSVAFYHSGGAFDATVSLMAADVRDGARWTLDRTRTVARNVQPEGGGGPSWGPSRGRSESGESARTLVYLQLTSTGVADLMVADLSAAESAGRRVRTKARVITGFDFAGVGRGAVTGQRGENYVAFRSHLLGSAFRAGWSPPPVDDSGGSQ